MANPTDDQTSSNGQRTVVVAIDESDHAEYAFDCCVVHLDMPKFSYHREHVQHHFFQYYRLHDNERSWKVYVENVKRAGDSVVLVTVPEYHSIFNSSSLFTDPATVEILVKEEQKRLQYLLQKYTRKMQNAKIGGKLREDVGKIGETILSIAQEENATLIVVGSRGRGKIRRTILGSVSDYCLHHSNVPVLICRMEV